MPISFKVPSQLLKERRGGLLSFIREPYFVEEIEIP